MKKTLRISFLAVALSIFGSNANAQEVTLDFTDNSTWNMPTSTTKDKGTFTANNYTITLEAESNGYRFFTNNSPAYSCILIGKSNATVTLPAFNFDVERIDVVGTANASAAVKQNIYVGDDAVSTETTGAKDVTNSYSIAADKQAAGTVYTLKVTSNHNTQIAKILIWKKGTSTTPETPEVQKITIAEAQAAANGTNVIVEGTVVASAANGAVLSDGTDYIYYYNTKNALTVGQKVSMEGALSTYGGAKQMPNSSTIKELGIETVNYPDAKELTGADFDNMVAAGTVERQYVKFVGSLSISGNYFNITIDGAEKAVGSIVKPLEDISALNGKTIAVTGYAMYLTGTKYVYVVATSIKENVADGISAVQAGASAAPAYNLSGQQVGAGYKGLVIKGGKKIVVR